MPENADEEVQFCYLKNGNLKKDPKFSQMYLLDQQNRTAILEAIEKRIAEFQKPLPQPAIFNEVAVKNSETHPTNHTVTFLDVLRPLNGSAEETLQFIMQKTKEAGFEYNIFSRVPKLDIGKNQYGLNGCIAAMIDLFTSSIILKRTTARRKSLKPTCSIPVIRLENSRLLFQNSGRIEALLNIWRNLNN